MDDGIASSGYVKFFGFGWLVAEMASVLASPGWLLIDMRSIP